MIGSRLLEINLPLYKIIQPSYGIIKDTCQGVPACIVQECFDRYPEWANSFIARHLLKVCLKIDTFPE